jgi:hypothetical protein
MPASCVPDDPTKIASKHPNAPSLHTQKACVHAYHTGATVMDPSSPTHPLSHTAIPIPECIVQGRSSAVIRDAYLHSGTLRQKGYDFLKASSTGHV